MKFIKDDNLFTDDERAAMDAARIVCIGGKYDAHSWPPGKDICQCGMYRWAENGEPEPTDTRAVAFNRGFDAFWESDEWPIDNPYKLGTSEYNFWRDGRNTALAQHNEATDAPQPPAGAGGEA